MPSRPLLDRSPDAILDALTRLLVSHPAASLGELAGMLGIGRTTLHRLYPTREALLHAAALRALQGQHDLDARMELDRLFGEDFGVETSWERLHEWLTALIPLGPQLMFLLRQETLGGDADLVGAMRALDAALLGALRRGAERRALRRDVPAPWLLASLHALVFAAWESVADGEVAPRDAARLVLTTWRCGLEEPPAAGRVP